MPDRGEVRSAGGETRQWDGSRWQPVTSESPSPPVDKPISFGALDYVPGLRDILNLPANVVKGAEATPDIVRGLVHEPASTLKGFVQGASEAATPGRVGLLSLLTGGATLPATLAAAGGEALAQGGRVATNAANAPQSLSDAAGDIAEAASIPAVAAGLKAVPETVQRLGGTKKVAGRVLGAGIGGYEGYKYGGIPGAIAGAAGGGALGGVAGGGPRTLRVLRAILGPEGAVNAAETAAEPVEAEASDVAAPSSVRLSNVELSPEAVARNIEATNLRDMQGFSHNMAGKLAGIPGAGQASVTNVPMGEWTITDEMIRNRGGVPSEVPEDVPDIDPDSVVHDRLSMKGLRDALKATQDPETAAMRDELVRRYLASQPNSPLSQLPDDDEMAADVVGRNVSGQWQRQ